MPRLKHPNHFHGEHRKIRSTCKSCKKDGKKDHSLNKHRFHGFGSFEATHIGYCSKHECGSQDDPTVYRKAAKKRAAKKKK